VSRHFARVFGASLAVCAALLTACNPLQPPAGASSNPPATRPAPAPAHTAELKLGFSAGELDGMSAPDVASTLDRYQDAGGSVIRFDVPWSGIQANGPDSWNWSSTDAVVDALSARGLTALPILDYTPAWARSDGCTTYRCAPADPAQFATFAKAAAQRYAAKGVKTWEIWNEQNTGWEPTPSIKQYGRLLQLTSAAIRDVQPRATILVGGLAPAATENGMYSPQDFVKNLYIRGFGSSFDGVAVHPYTFPALPGEGQAWSGWSQMIAVHKVMASYGDGAKGVWATEFGAPTKGSRAMATPANREYDSAPDHVDEALQADTVDAALTAGRQLPWLRMLLWYSVQDLGTDTSQNYQWFGLERGDGSAKPALARWQAAVRSLSH
jgi:hypothetical protein